jgi:hypothetical protein
MTADTFVCDCGQSLIMKMKPGAYYQHRRDYHAYCGQCRCEPCQCEERGLKERNGVMTITEKIDCNATYQREEPADDLSDIDEGPL